MLQYNPTVSGSSTVSGSIYVNSPNQTMGQFVGNQNGYVEFSIRNTNTGASASGDIAVYADNGTTLNNYIDMGINNSGLDSAYFYGGTDFGNALDAYVYNVGGNLRIGNATSAAPYSQSFYLFSNPAATPNIAITGSQVAINKSSSLNGTLDVNGDTIVTGSLKVSAGITGSFAGTASYAAQALTASNATTAITANTASYVITAQTASYVLNAVSSSFATTSVTSSYANNFNIAGTLTAQTINVQYITSSIEFNTGSTRNGTLTSNTHQFTGSVLVTGSVTSTGVISINGTGGTYGLLDISSTPATSYASLALRGNSRGGEVDFYDGTTVGASIVGGVGTDKSLYFYTSGSSSVKMTIKDSGNVGIGTITPYGKLNISNGGAAGLEFDATGGASGGGYIQAYNRSTNAFTSLDVYSNLVTFQTGTGSISTERMRITGTGNVGIGTNNPGAKLSIIGNNDSLLLDVDSAGFSGRYALLPGRFVVGTLGSGYPQIGYNFAMTNNVYTKLGNDTAWGIDFGNSNLMQFKYAATGTGTFSFNTALTINSSGNVGIGTTSPSYNLSVASYLGVGAQGGSDIVLIGGGSGVGAFIQLRYADGTVNTSLAGNNNSYLNANYGNTGIGTTNPANKLSVLGEIAKYCTTAGVDGSFQNLIKYGYGPDLTSGNATANRWLGIDASVTAGSAAANILRIRAYGGGTGNGAPVNVVDFKGDQTSAFYGSIAVTGAITATGDVTAYSSDKRLKENITNIPSALDKILSLNGITYDWNKKALDFGFVPDRLKHDVGLIAQEVQSVLPEAIAPAPFDTDSTTGESISGENYLTVRYDKLVPLLIEAIKEQQTQIDKLNKLLNN